MPTLDRLANQGLKYNRFHTTALCSPTRVAILTGRNHHSNNAGAIMEVATAFPGNTGARPQSITPLAEILRQNGYSTGAFGKYHETAPWEVSVSGPFDRWPTHSGFDKFYGFIGGETNQWAPLVYDGTVKVEVEMTPDYHFTTDMTNQAIRWIRAQQSLTPDKPFFTYFATGATHAPHHVPKDWIAKFKGKFDAGWDVYRQADLRAAEEAGHHSPEREAGRPACRHQGVGHAQCRREAAVRAADGSVRGVCRAHRLRDRPRRAGARRPGRARQHADLLRGRRQRRQRRGRHVRHVQRDDLLQRRRRDRARHAQEHRQVGRPETFPHMAAGWAVAGNTPFMWTKQVASNFGGTRNPLVVSWPARIKAKGEIRSQFQHVIDIAPTVLEAANMPEPKTVNGVTQAPMEGVSMVYTFDDAKAAERHKTQYFEIFGNRAIYHDGWVAAHRAQGAVGSGAAPRRSPTTSGSSTTSTRTSARPTTSPKSNPAKLKELQAVFMKEAENYRVLPIDDRALERFDPAMAGPPGPDGRPQVAHRLRGHDRHDGERLHQRQEPVVDRSRPTSRSRPAPPTA